MAVLLASAPVLDVRPAFEARTEAPKDPEQRALHEAYRARCDASHGPLSEPAFTFREVRQPFLGKRRLYIATGWNHGGHRPLPALWLVREKQQTLVLLAEKRALGADGYRQELTEVRLCPFASVLEEAATLRDGGVPEAGWRETTCTTVTAELRAAMTGRDQAARAEGLTLLLAALVDGSEPGLTVTKSEDLARGYLDALAGRVSPGFQRYAPRASNVSPFFTTVASGRTAAQGLVRSGPGARVLETVSMAVTAEKLEFSREQLVRELVIVE